MNNITFISYKMAGIKLEESFNVHSELDIKEEIPGDEDYYETGRFNVDYTNSFIF